MHIFNSAIEMKQKYDIFISYRRQDAGDKAEHLKDLLEPFYRNRISFDRENLSGKFNSQLIHRIDTVKDFLLVLGKNSLCFSEEDYTVERVKLYEELCSMPEEDFARRIIEVEKQTIIDYVRIEIGRALRKNNLNIIPVVPERSFEYSFASLNLPKDIAQIKSYEAVTYSDSPDALFKDVLPKVRKHLQSKSDLIINKSALAVTFLALTVAIGGGGYAYWCHTHALNLEKQRKTIMSTLEEKYQSYGLNFYDNDTITISEMAAIDDILGKMQDVVPDSLKMGMYEVTVGQWAGIMKQSYAPEDSIMPKTNVSLGDCLNFADKLYNLTNIPFEIPTEKDWEYAARGGMKYDGTLYSGSNDVDSVAWYKGNSGGKAHQCDGGLYANGCGIFDMSGNVGEICNSPYFKDETDGKWMACKVIRGGDFSSSAKNVTIEARVPFDQNDKGNDKVGFRLIIRTD